MKITDFLAPDRVIAELKSESKDAVLREIAVHIATRHGSLTAEKVFEVLLERERISTTAIGEGVAIPHGKLAGIDNVIGAFARSPQGVEFASLDGEPTHLLFALIAPENSGADHLKALARISRLLKESSFRDRLMKAADRDQIFSIIRTEDEKF